jgi:hypothetical protein
MALGFLMVGAGWLVLNASFHPYPSSAAVPGYSSEGPNKPVGTAKGLFPGRVVWVRDSAATRWNGSSGNWWTDANTDQAAVDRMMSRMLQTYANATSDSAAWAAIFKSYNSTHGRGNNGYQSGEKIVIKINANPDNGSAWGNAGYASPHVVYALISHLITVVGVKGTDITIAEPSRYVGDPIYNKIRANSNPEFKNVWFAEKQAGTVPQRIFAAPDTTSALYVKLGNNTDTKYYLPKCYTAAMYLINLAQLRPHRVFGITLGAKNHMGSIYDVGSKNYQPGKLHDFAVWDYTYPNKMGTRHCNPYLTGHKELGGKTLVYLADGLYTALNQGGLPTRWSTYGNDWCSSLFISQDPVAIESVGLDAICSEPNLTNPNTCFTTANAPNVENFLHESALADNPPSGTVYDPEKDGTKLASLGVHEHWNNATDKKYSRNLSATGTGIELLFMDMNSKTAIAQPGSLTRTDALSRIESVHFESGKIAIGYTLSAPDKISVEVMDMRGRVVADAKTEFQSAGFHRIEVGLNRSVKQTAGANRFIVCLKTSKGSVTKSSALF